ncbi:MAG: Thiol-disulfide interchange protein DsbG precursor [Leptospirillum sp. Group II 'C75']|jgi:thiol:disulfide interchange protein DsbG|uniref:Thiol-disulfide interchange protein DsbG precursor n=1 Tax=Leptospirillum sp. Group II 'CF-1' TaxID=1660083 RepID=UPI00029CAEE9|nr:Thiol-disulfide interchange protein DsbG precursor [Leptospirillum sp. Group II 'CF-1']EIJ75189.1 MAG: Thiol-disulfide interchange protein DsbG precursor [Leptospirillum sp. Group II 'C75']
MQCISSGKAGSPEILSKQAVGFLTAILSLFALVACHKTTSLSPASQNGGLLNSARLLIGTLSKNRASVVRIYPGPDGLVGVIFKKPSGSMGVVWMTPHGAAIVPGPVITAAGQDLTRIAQTAVDAVSKTLPAGSTSSVTSGNDGTLPGPESLSGDKTPNPAKNSAAQGKKMSDDDFLLMSRHLKSIVLGSGNREIWIYFDPNCIFCNRLWEEMKPYADQVKSHWIPVGFLKKDDSLKKATGILQAHHPLLALRENENRFDTETEEGGYPNPEKIDVASERSVATNTIGLGQATGELATPTIVYQGTDGKAHSVMGMPEDLRTFLEGVKKQDGH